MKSVYLDPDEMPFRPTYVDGVPMKIKDMSPFQKSMYRKWLKFKKAYPKLFEDIK